jgi:hypothetical protein
MRQAYQSPIIDHLPIIPPVFHYEKIPKVKMQTDIVISLLKRYSHDDIVIA